MIKETYILLFLHVISLPVFCQKVYFADGYHGGIYGHYPIEWKTQFIVDTFNRHPEWKISLEIEPETWDTVRARTPEAYRQLKEIATSDRVEFTNPTYTQPYCYNISGESIIRQFEYGIKKTRQHFPEVTFTTYSVEEPCFTSCLPQILQSFGFKYAVLKTPNTCWGGYMQAYGGELVNWIGPDGTSILTVPRYACEELEENSTWQTKAWANSSSYIKACFDDGIAHPVGMCFQDAGWKNGPWLGSGNRIKNNSIYITWKEYIENISIGKTNDNRHYTQEDIRVNLMWGSQVLQRIAQQVRTAENQIVMAEKLATMAYLENSHVYSQHHVDEAWRTLMLAQHHDSWIVPYNRLNKHHTWAEEIEQWTAKTCTLSTDIINKALASFESSTSGIPKEGFIRVYNTQGVGRTEITSITLPQEYAKKAFSIWNARKKEVPYTMEKEGEKIKVFFKAEVPPFGYTTYSIKKKQSGKEDVSGITFTETNECIIENDMYRIVLDRSKGGTIQSLIAKKEKNKEFADRTSKFALAELRGFFYEDNAFHSSAEHPARITVIKDHALETSVQIDGEIAGHPFTQIISIVQGQRRIDFDLTIGWKNNVGIGEYKQGADWQKNRRAFCDDRFKLNVLFPVNLQSPQLYKNAPFDVCESTLDHTFFKTWDSIKHNVILHWVDLVEKKNKYGLALLSDHTTSYSYGDDSPLGLTAQYSGIGLWGWDYRITQPLHLKYALVPHREKWDKAGIATEINNWNEPLIAAYYTDVTMQNKSWINTEDTGYEVSAVNLQDGSMLIRLFNADGDDSPQKVRLGFLASGTEMTVSMPRFGLRTFLFKRNSVNEFNIIQ